MQNKNLTKLKTISLGEPWKKRQKPQSLCEVRGGSKIWCVNLKKVVIFSYLELQKTEVFGQSLEKSVMVHGCVG